MQTGEFENRDPAGRAFTRNRLKRLLRNPVYVGKIACNGELYQGEHEATVTPEVWQQANELRRGLVLGGRVRPKCTVMWQGSAGVRPRGLDGLAD
jgi:hypothetical protein